MKARFNHTDQLLNELIKLFKKGEHLPFSIITTSCPNKNNKCKKKHGEQVVQSYNRTANNFHIIVYGVHEKGIMFEWDANEEKIKEMVLRSITKKKHTRKSLYPIRTLEKIVDKKKVYRTEFVGMKFTYKEKKMLESSAKKQGIDVSEFIRKKLFTQ